MLEKLKSAGLAFEQQQDATQVLSDTLQGKRFVISGTFTQSREDIKNLIAANGGKVLASITGQTDYFLTGAKTGPSKMKKAAELGIPTINENEFMALIKKPQTLF
jgi:DNA ligase (NAD+)